MKANLVDFNSVLSPLESDVLHALWSSSMLRVREIHKKLRKNVAISSVAVICDRLHEKGIVGRKLETARGGVRYVYFPLNNRRSFEKSIVETTVNRLIKAFGSNAVSYFNKRFRKR